MMANCNSNTENPKMLRSDITFLPVVKVVEPNISFLCVKKQMTVTTEKWILLMARGYSLIIRYIVSVPVKFS
jgi:hypothetical protein